ncbi:MAG: hypothetical protein CM1200mP16_08210 [Nitrospina sp.]|nr:MAG: hypothetical protein CM1200mP16_08210 [Nitrospina sp.]
MSPIHAKDVASIFVKSINEMKTVKKTYHLGGKPIFWKDIIKIISGAYGKKKWTFLHLLCLSNRWLQYFGENLHGFQLQKIKLQCLWKGTSAIPKKYSALLKIKPIPFNSESLSYLKD